MALCNPQPKQSGVEGSREPASVKQEPGEGKPAEELQQKPTTHLPDIASDDIKVGDICIGKSRKDTKKYNNVKCEVIKVLTRKVRVKILQGPAEGEERDYDKMQVLRVVDNSDGADAANASDAHPVLEVGEGQVQQPEVPAESAKDAAFRLFPKVGGDASGDDEL